MFAASAQGNLKEVRRLAGNNCTAVNWQHNDSGIAPLHLASYFNHTQVVLFLLSCKADPNVQTYEEGLTPLMAALLNVDILHALMTAHPDLNLKTVNGTTALMGAAEYNSLDAAKVLLTGGAEANLQDELGKTALIYASINATLDMTITLLNYGADVDIQDHDGKTALHFAVEKNEKEQVQALLEHGSNGMIKSKAGKTAGDIANENGFISLLKFMENYTETTNIFILVGCIIASVVVVIIILSGCMYCRYRRRKQSSLQNTIVVFRNDEDQHTEHIYEN
ncbi:unnamed protein product [Meganyctiphanes norvegica]|uniref:Uncharacterized protein n=1 Tax=Meganyctiphanes norvegica TaxID=48144 RepID=A0AAV2RTI8_MEGNR